MAVIEAIPGVAITVQVAGRPLKEWPDDNEDPRHHAVVRYVEAVSGQEFDIKVQVQDEAVFQENSLTFHVHIDGQRTQSFTSWPGGRKVTIFRGIRDATSMRRYRFSNLQITSDDHHLDDEPEQLDGLGEIQVLMYHTRKIDEPRKRQPLPRNYREQSIVSEKMLKGQSVSHCVAFGPAVPLGALRMAPDGQEALLPWRLAYPAGKATAANFQFRYRSLESLKIMMIVPRTPSPEPVERCDSDSLATEEKTALQQQVLHQKDGDQAKIKMKRERDYESPRPRKAGRLSVGSPLLELQGEDGISSQKSTESSQRRKLPDVIELD